MRYIDCRLVHISGNKTMVYGISPSLPGYEMVPRQLYYGQTEWRDYPGDWIDSAWTRTRIFQTQKPDFYLPSAEWLLGSVGFTYILFRVAKNSELSQRLGHRRAPHLKAFRQLADLLQLVKVD